MQCSLYNDNVNLAIFYLLELLEGINM